MKTAAASLLVATLLLAGCCRPVETREEIARPLRTPDGQFTGRDEKGTIVKITECGRVTRVETNWPVWIWE